MLGFLLVEEAHTYIYMASSRKVVAGWLEGVFLCTL